MGLIVEVLASALAGAVPSRAASPFSGPNGGPPGTGQCFIALDPTAFAPGFVERITTLAAAIDQQPGARLPGARRRAARARSDATGVEVDADLAARLSIESN